MQTLIDPFRMAISSFIAIRLAFFFLDIPDDLPREDGARYRSAV
jgi:hypothetical protein